VKVALKLFKENELVLMFPEGTRNGITKGIKPKDGAVTIALKAEVPIIPIGMQGSFKSFRKVKVNIGKPIYYNKNEIDMKDKTQLEKLTKELMEEIVKLTNERI
jgi:1-acyl-sn-glycerol-3-phosphate acyltransferase